jgi:N-methylhydantoinase A/oxoprolinase/acetone carboxylase beta subunit
MGGSRSQRRVRIGIDVGGTFTKGVAIDCDTLMILGKASVLTTHTAAEGVAKGVVQVFEKLLKDYDIDPRNVSFLAHSTTQATNALLEGDVAPVGIIGMGRGVEALVAKGDTSIDRMELADGRYLNTFHEFMSSDDVNEATARESVERLIKAGARSIVASEAWSVDDPRNELKIMSVCQDLDIPSTGGHAITKLYGLRARTVTAVANASILPKMIETAQMVESSVTKAGISAPVMIMRGDGGVMNINEMRKRPVLTMLSGPAASVAGALMYLRVTDGIFFEVGGTSTNIGVIKGGRPILKYVKLESHNTFVNSLDVRVKGVAGGSMVRVRGNRIVEVGPRSAHIAGFPYEAFAKTEEIVDPQVIFVQPHAGDPKDYVAIKTGMGKVFAITTTGAANVLGFAKPGDYSHGNPEAARKAIEPLAKMLGLTVEETCTQILEAASKKVVGVIEDLVREYELNKEQTTLVGGGGGAAALIPFIAKKLNMEYRISDNAEVISSIGVALAMVCDIVERTIPNPTSEDIAMVVNEAKASAARSGAVPETIECFVEVDSRTHKVRVIAQGSVEIRTQDLSKAVTPAEACQIAAKALRLDSVEPVGKTNSFYLFRGEKKEKFLFLTTKKPMLCVLDTHGSARLRCEDIDVIETTVRNIDAALRNSWERFTFNGQPDVIAEMYLIVSGRIIDLSHLEIHRWDQVEAVARHGLAGYAPDERVFIVGKGRIQAG